MRFSSSLYAKSVRLEVSNNGIRSRVNVSTDGAWYTFDSRVKIQEHSPQFFANYRKFFRLGVTGENFLPTDELKCKFGNKIVQAVWLNGAELVCRTPPHVEGLYALEVTVNDQDYTDQRIPFLFYKPLSLEHITPVSGPGEVAGTEVHIYSENFTNVSTLRADFLIQMFLEFMLAPPKLSAIPLRV